MRGEERPWDLEPSMIALGAVYAASILGSIVMFAVFGF